MVNWPTARLHGFDISKSMTFNKSPAVAPGMTVHRREEWTDPANPL
jgi:hypothetical protein